MGSLGRSLQPIIKSWVGFPVSAEFSLPYTDRESAYGTRVAMTAT